jgi:hypothetical protein
LSLPVRCEDCWQDLASVRCQATLSDGSFWLIYIYIHSSTILVIWWGCNRDIHSAMTKNGILIEWIYIIYTQTYQYNIHWHNRMYTLW